MSPKGLGVKDLDNILVALGGDGNFKRQGLWEVFWLLDMPLRWIVGPVLPLFHFWT
jgi:hypothetical protein